MSLPATIAPDVLDIILGHLASLFLSAGDPTAARHAASQMLAAYKVETEQELHLAADIISFGLHALEALSQATAPDRSLNQVLRLRGSAVSLSRESHKAQRKLDQLQRARRAAAHQPAAEIQPEAPASRPDATQAQPLIDNATGPIENATGELASKPIEPAGKNNGMTWTQSYRQRQTSKRLAKKMLKAQVRQVAEQGAMPAAQDARPAA